MLTLEDIDMDMLAFAMQDDGSMGTDYYLNLDTGQVVVPGFEEDLDMEDIEVGNYAYIERIESYESYRHMEDFTFSLPEGPARTALEQALVRSHPFRHFKDALDYFPDEREAWVEFKDAAMRTVIVRWLVGIDAIEDPDSDFSAEDEEE